MTIKERIRTDWEAIRSAPTEKKWSFFLDYYKWPALVCLAVLLIVISSIHTTVTAKDPFLSGIALNCNSVVDSGAVPSLNDKLLEYARQDSRKTELEINTAFSYVPDSQRAAEDNYNTVQQIGIETAARTLDFVVGDAQSMLALASAEWFADLSTILPAEMSPWFVEVEGTALFLNVQTNPEFAEMYSYLNGPVLLAVTVTTPRIQNIVTLAEFLAGSMVLGG